MSRELSIAVLGAGPGGLAGAAALSRRGFDVRLFNRTTSRIEKLAEMGGIEIEGDLGEEFIPLPVITTDIAQVVKGAGLIMCFTPANGQRLMAELVAPLIEPGAAFLYCSGSCGSLEAARIFERAGRDVRDDVLLGETLTLPQSARVTESGRLRIRLPSTVRTAAFPARNNDRLYDVLDGVIKFCPAPNVLDTGINNVNFIIHPAPMLLNYAAVERAEGRLSIMNEGMTAGVLRAMDALDAEKMALATALGLTPTPVDDLYRESGSGPHVYRRKGEPFGLRDRIWPRYLEEDTPFGTVMLSSLGKQLGVSMPVCDSINILLSMLEQRDFAAEGRTVETLGLAGMSADEMNEYVVTGVRGAAAQRARSVSVRR